MAVACGPCPVPTKRGRGVTGSRGGASGGPATKEKKYGSHHVYIGSMGSAMGNRGQGRLAGERVQYTKEGEASRAGTILVRTRIKVINYPFQNDTNQSRYGMRKASTRKQRIAGARAIQGSRFPRKETST